jgi:hypothetical protein
VAIARLRAHRLLGLWQKPGMAMRISEGSLEDLVPSGGHILRIAVQHFFRLIAERENRLRRRITRHTKPFRFACKRTNESTTQADRAYRGTRGIQARHGGVATRDCGEPAPCPKSDGGDHDDLGVSTALRDSATMHLVSLRADSGNHESPTIHAFRGCGPANTLNFDAKVQPATCLQAKQPPRSGLHPSDLAWPRESPLDTGFLPPRDFGKGTACANERLPRA